MLDDLRRRLERTRLPDQLDGTGWDYGAELGCVSGLVAYWRDEFDSRGRPVGPRTVRSATDRF